MALCTSAAATALSTPPLSAQMTRPVPTRARTAATCSSMIDAIVQVGVALGEHVQERLQHEHARAASGRLRGATARPRCGARRAPSRRPARRAWTTVHTKPSGGTVTASKWLIHTSCSSGVPTSSADSPSRVTLARPYSPRRPRPTVPPSCWAMSWCAVADAQDGDAEVVDGGVERRRALDVHAGRAAAEDDRRRRPLGHLGGRDAVRHDLGVHVQLTHPTCDQLGVLRSEVHHQHRVRTLRHRLDRRGWGWCGVTSVRRDVFPIPEFRGRGAFRRGPCDDGGMSRMVRAWSSVAVALLLGAPVLAACSDGPNPFQAASQSTTTTVRTADTTTGSHRRRGRQPVPARGQHQRLRRRARAPELRQQAKGTKGTYMVFAVLILGLAFIFWRIAKGVKARDAVVNAPKPGTPGPAAP